MHFHSSIIASRTFVWSRKKYPVGKKCQIFGMAVVMGHCTQSRPNLGNFPLVLKLFLTFPTCPAQQMRQQVSVQLLLPCQSWGFESSRLAKNRDEFFGVQTSRYTIAIPKKGGAGRLGEDPNRTAVHGTYHGPLHPIETEFGELPVVLRLRSVLPTFPARQMRLQVSVQQLLPCQTWESDSSSNV